ncbi:50S ribosomal protein L29 [Candidatus Dependentiae bacterium]|nr:50S ribosomal protein L29 [Candidatus Dependentiae bacterium]
MKSSEFKQYNEVELNKKISESEEELFNLRFKRTLSPLDDPKRIKVLKKNIARMKTLLNEKKRGS